MQRWVLGYHRMDHEYLAYVQRESNHHDPLLEQLEQEFNHSLNCLVLIHIWVVSSKDRI